MKTLATLNSLSAEHQDSVWGRTADYVKQERPLHPIEKIVVSGAVDVVFFRSPNAHLVVAGETLEAANQIQTTYTGRTLIIQHRGVSISGAGGNIHISGSGNIVAGGDIYVGGRSVHMQFNGQAGGVSLTDGGRCVVGIALPEAPDVDVTGSSEIGLHGLEQQSLTLSVSGSGVITADGAVAHLDAEITGSGKIDSRSLHVGSARLSVCGSGKCKALVYNAVHARVTGSGGVVVHGNPVDRNESVTGSGKIKFK